MNALGGRDVVCVGFNDWDNEVWTNQHHLMSRLAAGGSRVLFIESLGLRRPSLGSGRDLSRIARRLRRGLSAPRAYGGVMVLSPLVLPLHSYPRVRRLNARLLRARVARATGRLGFHHPVLWGYVPQAEVLLDMLEPELVIYHCVDDIASQAGIDSPSFAAAERALCASCGPRDRQRARPGAANAPALEQRAVRTQCRGYSELRRMRCEPGPVDAQLASLAEPRIVFVGAIAAKKLDFALLLGIARARRGWTLALIGPIGLGDPETDVSALAEEPNIHLLGPRRPRGICHRCFAARRSA